MNLETKIMKLGDLVTSKKGKIAKDRQKMKNSTHTLPYLTTKVLDGNQEPEYCEEGRWIECIESDVLLSWDGSIGKVYIGKKGVVASTFVKLNSDRLTPYFLYYFLLLNQEYIASRPKGVGVPHINPEILWNLEIPLVDMNEQKKYSKSARDFIENIIEIETNLTEVKAQKQGLMLSVINSALEGKLKSNNTDKSINYSNNYGSAEDLLKQILVERQKLFTANYPNKKYKKPLDTKIDFKNNLPNGWVYATVDQICTKLDQGWSPRCSPQPKASNLDWGVVKTSAIHPFIFDGQQHKTLPNSLTPKEHLEINEGDLIITRKGPRKRCGVSCLVRSTPPRVMLTDTTYRLKFIPELIDLNYIEAVFNSASVLNQLEKAKSGINDSGVSITQGIVKSLIIPLPPLNEQLIIGQEINSILGKIQALEENINENLEILPLYKISFMKKLMSGE